MNVSEVADNRSRWPITLASKVVVTSRNWPILLIPFVLMLLQVHLLLRHTVPHVNACSTRARWARTARLLLVFPIAGTCFWIASNMRFVAQVTGEPLVKQQFNVGLACHMFSYILLALDRALSTRAPELRAAKKLEGTAEMDAKANGHATDGEAYTNGDASAVRPALPTYFPGTRVPLELDYLVNFRGLGWAWGIPSPAGSGVEVQSRLRFVLNALRTFAVGFLVADTADALVHCSWTLPGGFTKPGSLWDARNGALGYAGVFVVMYSMAAIIYGGMQYPYAILSALGVICGTPPSYWTPEPHNRPYAATSLSSFWSQRWHAHYRSIFMSIGFRPMRYLFRPFGRPVSRAAGLLGAFLVSGLLHEAGMWGMMLDTDSRVQAAWGTATTFFVLQWIGVLLEQRWEAVTGWPVQGPLGWLWTFTWIFSCAAPVVDGWMRLGYGVHFGFPHLGTRLIGLVMK